jgi:hypothetical protein
MSRGGGRRAGHIHRRARHPLPLLRIQVERDAVDAGTRPELIVRHSNNMVAVHDIDVVVHVNVVDRSRSRDVAHELVVVVHHGDIVNLRDVYVGDVDLAHIAR